MDGGGQVRRRGKTARTEAGIPERVSCARCGAEYDSGLAACPYCQAENPWEARRREQAAWQRHRRRLQALENLPAKLSRKGGRWTLRVALVLGALGLLAGVGTAVWNSTIGEEQALEEWESQQEENDAWAGQLEQLLAAEDYEALFSFLDQHDLYGSRYGKYREVVYAWDGVRAAREGEERLAAGETLEDGELRNLLLACGDALETIDSGTGDSAVRGNEALLESFGEEIRNFLQDRLLLTEDEVERIPTWSSSWEEAEQWAQEIASRLESEVQP